MTRSDLIRYCLAC